MLQLAPSERSHILSGTDIKRCNNDERWRWPSFGFCCLKSNGGCPNNITDENSNNAKTKSSSWSVILFGQTIALALSCANAASSTLENDYQIKVPTFQTGLVYFLLSIHLMYLFWRHRIKQKDGKYERIDDIPCDLQQLSMEYSDPSPYNTTTKLVPSPAHKFPFTTLPLHTPWYTYLLLSILDVEANYLAMLSFQHTSLSSSMLLTSLSVLSTVLLRRMIFQSANYGRTRLLGVFMCLIGGCLWLRVEFHHNVGGENEVNIDDTSGTSFQTSSKPTHMYAIQGDLLALSAAFLYGLNDVLAEYFIKANNDRVEYLGMLGFFGSLFSFTVQVPLLEKDRLRKLFVGVLVLQDDTTFDYSGSADHFTSVMGAVFLLLCFIIMLCYFYISVMAFLSVHDSTILNLSLQSCPLWAVVLTMLQKSLTEGSGWLVLPPAMFFVSLSMVVVGMFLYESHSESEINSTCVNGTCISNDKQTELDRDYNNEVI
mmetsp:Transcript_3670/g.6907  ORF Transcript_3670/g.6907 Transcript_3670/m.6907 type:complete len:485 (+) Transcript_3670:59-1513(+)